MFIGDVGHVFAKPIRCCVEREMTALAICYVLPGFCLAADGRAASDENNALTVTNDSAQKIFTTGGKHFHLAYTMSGEIMSDDYSYDLVSETAKLNSRLSSKPFSSFADYSHKFGEKLRRRINEVKKAGKLNPYPNPKPLIDYGDRASLIAEVSVIGYFQSAPVWRIFQFVHEANRAALNVIDWPIAPGANYATGSRLVPELAVKGDTRLSKYCQHISQRPEQMKSLDDAANYVTAYVEVCCEPIAKEIDPICKMSGGHVHVAEITPSGFKWRIAPKEQGQSLSQ